MTGITLLRNHQDCGTKAPSQQAVVNGVMGREGHNSGGGCLGLWRANTHLKYQQPQTSPRESARTVFIPVSCMNLHLPTETSSILPSYVLGAQLRAESYTSNWMIMQRKRNRVYLGLFRHDPAITRPSHKEQNNLVWPMGAHKCDRQNPLTRVHLHTHKLNVRVGCSHLLLLTSLSVPLAWVNRKTTASAYIIFLAWRIGQLNIYWLTYLTYFLFPFTKASRKSMKWV